MKKLASLVLILCMALGISAVAETQVLTGEAAGFGGPVLVEVTVVDGVITEVKATGDMETAGIDISQTFFFRPYRSRQRQRGCSGLFHQRDFCHRHFRQGRKNRIRVL